MTARIFFLGTFLLFTTQALASNSTWMKKGDVAVAHLAFDEAIKYYSIVIESEPLNIHAWLKRAKVYQMTARYVRSAEDLKKAYQVDPVLFEKILSSSKNMNLKRKH